MTANNDGPYLSVAAICEQILEEKDGFLSAIRFTDKITLIPAFEMPPEQLRKASITIHALVSFKSGSFRGKKTVKLKMTYPSGREFPSDMNFPALFEGDNTGASLILSLVFPAEEEGLHWFDVLLDEEFVTRIPLRIIYGHRQSQPSEIENPKTNEQAPVGS